MPLDYDTLVRQAGSIDDLLDLIDDYTPLTITSRLHIQTIVNGTMKEIVSCTYYNVFQQVDKILNGYADNPSLLLEELHDLRRMLGLYGLPQVIDSLEEQYTENKND